MKKKIYILTANENWICDKLDEEWKANNKELYADNIIDADIIWILSDYIANKIPEPFFKNKIVYTTIHHIVPWKVDENKRKHFEFLNRITTFFITIEAKCQETLAKYVTKPIKVIPFWNNENMWRCLNESHNFNKYEYRKRYNIPGDDYYVIGSFQRDTEGSGISHGLFEPKLEKGPDLLIKSILALRKKEQREIFVVLAGYRRQYIITELKTHNIEYIYYEKCYDNTLNELYNCLDLYIVSSRVEGGPRAINECGLTKTPLITTDVGIARLMCHPDSIFDMNNIDETVVKARPNVQYLYDEAQKYTIKNYMKQFTKEMFRNLL